MWHRAAVERAKLVIVEESRGLLYACGVDNGIRVGEVDYVIDDDKAPTPELLNPAATEANIAVAGLIATEVEDGAYLLIAIGGMPNAVCSLLVESGAA